jgi:multiple sugar transport system substrate-binding protein
LLPFLEKLTVDANGVSADQPGFDPKKIVQYGMGTSPDSTQAFADTYMAQNGGGYQETPGGPPTVNSAANVAAYHFISDLMYKYHVAPPGASVIAPNAGAEQQQFLSGKVATLMGGDWLISAFQAGAKFKFGVGPVPTGPKGHLSAINAGAFSIPSSSKYPDQAWALVSYLTRMAGQTTMAGTGAIQPSISSLGSVYASAWKPKGVDPTAFTPQAVGTVFSVPTGPNIDAVQNATDLAVAAIYLNTSSVQAALDAAQTAATDAYKGNG